MYNSARVRNDFDDAAERYDAHASLQQRVQKHLAARLGIMSANARVLDAGCGTGTFANTLKGRNIIALDNAYRMCVEARRTGALSLNADMSTLPFADASFDVVFSSLALQWAHDWRATLHEWLRVLKPTGILAFSTFSAGTLHELAESFSIIDTYPHVSHFMQADAIEKEFSAEITTETITEYYPDVVTLARHLKALGARNKQQSQRPALMTPRQLRLVEQRYAKSYSTGNGLPVSWNILYATMQKP